MYIKMNFLLALMLTTRQCRVTGDTDAGLLPVHVHEPALQAAARRTEHLKKHKVKYIIMCFCYRLRTLDKKNTFYCEEF